MLWIVRAIISGITNLLLMPIKAFLVVIQFIFDARKQGRFLKFILSLVVDILYLKPIFRGLGFILRLVWYIVNPAPKLRLLGGLVFRQFISDDIATHFQRTMRNVQSLRRHEKVTCSFVLGLVLAVATSRKLAAFIDTLVMVFFYSIWILVCAPSLYKTLTVKFMTTVALVVFQIVFTDICVTHGYRHLRLHTDGHIVLFDSMEQRAYMLLMNCTRAIFLLICLSRIVTVYQKKLAQSKRYTLNHWLLPWSMPRTPKRGRANNKSASANNKSASAITCKSYDNTDNEISEAEVTDNMVKTDNCSQEPHVGSLFKVYHENPSETTENFNSAEPNIVGSQFNTYREAPYIEEYRA